MERKYSPEVGDIIIKSFINESGEKVFRHPFVIISVHDDLVFSLDERTIFGGFAVSDYESSEIGTIIMELENFGIFIASRKDDSSEKKIVQVDSLTLFAQDIVPLDKQGEVNPEIVTKALNLLDRLKAAGKLNINKNNLPKIVGDRRIEDKKISKEGNNEM